MKIFILSHDLSHNCLGRAAVFAEMLQDRHQVEIVGPAFGTDIWYPMRKIKTPIRKVDGELFLPQYTHLFGRLLEKIHCDLLIAIKPRPTSFGLALMKRELKRIPILLDIDDWEMGFYADQNWRTWDTEKLLRRPNSPLYTKILQRLIRKADEITVASEALRGRFGGHVIPHARDHNLFDPEKYDGEAMKRRLGLDNRRLIVFVGTPRPHKGIPELIDLTLSLPGDVDLLIAGATNDPQNTEEAQARERGKDRVHLLKVQPFEEIPAFLAMADLVVLPSSDSAVSRYQLPAKLIDAMAMARPIVASALSDMPSLLADGAGRVVPPGDAEALRQAVEEILSDPEQAKAMGLRARQRFLSEYSTQAVAPKLEKIIQSISTKGKRHVSEE